MTSRRKFPQLAISTFILVAYTLAIATMMIRVGEPTAFIWWIGALPFLAWCVAPVGAALFWRSWIAIVGTAAIAGWGWYEYNVGLFGPGARSTSGLLFLFVPIYQWMGIAVVLAASWLARRLIRI
jgi:ABC-type Na+ efflux pump permease subunit